VRRGSAGSPGRGCVAPGRSRPSEAAERPAIRADQSEGGDMKAAEDK
jgi:hypothetical protein